MEIGSYANYLVDWIKSNALAAKADGVIVGLSGGIDSAVVAALAAKAFPDNHLVVVMPCDSGKQDRLCAEEMIEKHHLKSKTVDLSATFATLKQSLKVKGADFSSLALANIKPRLRMTTLYALAQQNNYLVLGTDNADEWYLGYFTKHGDGGVDLLPIVHLLKSDVRAMAKYLSVPNSIIERPPSAGLWDQQTDEQELGFSYDLVDNYLQGKSIPEPIKHRILLWHQRSQHKRQGAKQPEKKLRNLIF